MRPEPPGFLQRLLFGRIPRASPLWLLRSQSPEPFLTGLVGGPYFWRPRYCRNPPARVADLERV